MTDTTALATPEQKPATLVPFRKASDILAAHLGLEPGVMIAAIKSTCFKCDPSKVTNEQLATFCSVAKEYNVNPLIQGLLYAYPKDGGIIAMMGPDLVFRLLSERKDVEGFGTEPVFNDKGQLVAATAWVKVTGKERFTYTAYLQEWVVTSNPNWKGRPIHMLTLRALKQVARYVIHGLPMDEDELAMVNAREVHFQERVPAPSTPPSRAQLIASKLSPPPAPPPEPEPVAQEAPSVPATASEEPDPTSGPTQEEIEEIEARERRDAQEDLAAGTEPSAPAKRGRKGAYAQ